MHPLDLNGDTQESAYVSLGNELLQAPQSLLGGLENIIVLAHGEAEIVLGNVGIGLRIELGRRDAGHANFVDEEPAELKIARAAGHMRREWIIFGELHRGHVGQHEVSTIGIGVLYQTLA